MSNVKKLSPKNASYAHDRVLYQNLKAIVKEVVRDLGAHLTLDSMPELIQQVQKELRLEAQLSAKPETKKGVS